MIKFNGKLFQLKKIYFIKVYRNKNIRISKYKKQWDSIHYLNIVKKSHTGNHTQIWQNHSAELLFR